MLVGDVPGQLAEELGVALVGGEGGVAAGVVTVFLTYELLYALHVGNRSIREVLRLIAYAVLGSAPAHGLGRCGDIFALHEEEQLILDDRTAEGTAVCGRAVGLAGTGDFGLVNRVTAHVLIAVVDVGRTLEGVGTALGDGVDAAADEVGLTHVKRCNHHLQLLNGVDGDRVAATGQVGTQTEVVVEVGTIDGEVSRTSVHTAEAHAVAAVRREACDVGDGAAYRRHVLYLRVVDVGCGAGLQISELCSLGRYDDLTELLCVL